MKPAVRKSCLIGPAQSQEQFIAEHLFFYLVKGTLSGYYGNKSYTLNEGEYGIVRKNQLGRQTNLKENDQVEKIIVVFDEPFLTAIQEKHKLVAGKFAAAEPFVPIMNEGLMPNFIQSLMPYYNGEGVVAPSFVDVKREELLLILLQSRPELAGVFFDYGIPAKINLEEFMNRNYQFNVSTERFAYLTGRSLSAFKRDFKQLFNDTPSNWLMQKRLREAHYLLEKKGKRPGEIYLDLGFEDFSHFSFAFKKLFGLAPTDVRTER